MAGGMRQTDSGAVLASTPSIGYKSSRVARVANLTMDEHGMVTGTVKLTYTGTPALRWRQIALSGDSAALEREMRTRAEQMLPGGLDIKVKSISMVTEYEQPLTVELSVQGGLGSFTGKRVLLPGELFEANSKPTFSHEKREVAIAFDYPYITQDAVRINFPASFAIESIPATETFNYQSAIGYGFKTESTPTSVTVRREFALGQILYMPESTRNCAASMEVREQGPRRQWF